MRTDTRDKGLGTMGRKINRPFSANLLTLQLQLKTLLEDSGGKNVADLLDALCQLNGAEQDIVLGIFNKIINKIASGEIRLSSTNDIKLKEFEQNLYNDIMQSMQQAASMRSGGLKLEVLDGGKRARTKPRRTVGDTASVLDLDEFRKFRKNPEKPILN